MIPQSYTFSVWSRVIAGMPQAMFRTKLATSMLPIAEILADGDIMLTIWSALATIRSRKIRSTSAVALFAGRDMANPYNMMLFIVD